MSGAYLGPEYSEIDIRLDAKKYNATILIYFEEFDDHKDAFAREKQLKNWHKDWKWNLAKVLNPELKDLYLDL